VILYDNLEGGQVVKTTGKVDRECFIDTGSNSYQLTYTTRNGILSLYKKDEKSEYFSMYSDALDQALVDRDFLDNEEESLGGPLTLFFTKALLTTLAGIPKKVQIKVGETSVIVGEDKIITKDSLENVFLAPYLASIL
jgi:hypothetical protein